VFLSLDFQALKYDLIFAENTFFTTIFNENETEKLITAPIKANIAVLIKSSDSRTGTVAKTVPPQVPTIVENDLKVILFNFNLD
jgi:hypothetical protein